jgi:diadenosine tetraphosphate (Ap4A) HIT family hydrolase
MNVPSMPTCELCSQDGGVPVWRDANWRVVRVQDAAFPAYYRVVCNHHVVEFGDLLAPERTRCMGLVVGVERVLRERLEPTKMNIASLGNVTPHVHWHVIARFDWDSHFPRPIWDAPQRAADAQRLQAIVQSLPELDAAVAAALNAQR